jgi:hypothetical protein
MKKFLKTAFFLIFHKILVAEILSLCLIFLSVSYHLNHGMDQSYGHFIHIIVQNYNIVSIRAVNLCQNLFVTTKYGTI